MTPGQRFRQALLGTKPLQIVGAPNALCALMATSAGHCAIYLSGAAVANGSFALPDLGITGITDTVTEARRITAVTNTPLLVDIDCGWGSTLSIARGTRELEQAGVAAIHIEDQIQAKRCGHRPDKQIVDIKTMQARINAVAANRGDNGLYIIARTDAYACEGADGVITRAADYLSAGAEAIFIDAVPSLAEFTRLSAAIKAPLLANMTEFGMTDILTRDQLHRAGIAMALYPLTAFRAMNHAAQRAYKHLHECGDQHALLDSMQTREQLYNHLNYLELEGQQDLERRSYE